jgi:hypothetical protein
MSLMRCVLFYGVVSGQSKDDNRWVMDDGLGVGRGYRRSDGTSWGDQV